MSDTPTSTPESCPVCGFVWTSVPRDQVGRRVLAATAATAERVRSAPAGRVGARPAPEVWSPLEYAAHLRDVLYNIRDRVVVGLAEDTPTFKPMYRDVRVEAGLYEGEEAAVVADELERAGALFARTIDALDDAQLGRPCYYTSQSPHRCTLLWLGQQAVHESEHHGDDIAAGLASG
jgi:hypothetical protein